MIMTGRFTVKLDLQTLRTSPNHSFPFELIMANVFNVNRDGPTDRQGQIYFEDFCFVSAWL